MQLKRLNTENNFTLLYQEEEGPARIARLTGTYAQGHKTVEGFLQAVLDYHGALYGDDTLYVLRHCDGTLHGPFRAEYVLDPSWKITAV